MPGHNSEKGASQKLREQTKRGGKRTRFAQSARGKVAYPWLVVVILLLIYTLGNFDRHVLAVLVEPIKRDLTLSDTQMSLLLGFAFAFFYTLVGLPVARLADRSNRRNIVAFGVALWSVATIVCGLARNYFQLFMARIGVGLGEACLNPAAIPLISDYFDKEKLGRALGVYMLGIPLGSGLASILGGALFAQISDDNTFTFWFIRDLRSWQLVLIVIGLSGLVIATLLGLIREPPRKGPLHKDGSGAMANYPLREIAGYIGRNWLPLFCIAWPLMFSALMTFGVGYWIPSFFIRSFPLDDQQAGTFLNYWGMVNLLFGATGVLIGGALADYLGRRHEDGHLRTLFIGVLLIGPAYSLFPLMPEPELSVLMLMPAALGGGILQTTGVVMMMTVCPNQMRAQISALYYFLVNLVGGVLGPTLIALLTDYVFADAGMLRYSLFGTALLMTLTSFAVLALGRGRYTIQD